MLATLVDEPFHRPGWVYEEKYDGYRILSYKEGARVTLRSRLGKDRSRTFARISDAVERLTTRTALVDGEVVAFDEQGVSRFQLLQRGGAKLHYAAFDCLFIDGQDIRRSPLTSRRKALESIIGRSGTLFLSRRLPRNGLMAYRRANELGLEGLVAKDSTSPYMEGRSKKWLKVKVRREEEFVIGGFTPPKGSRPYFGALLLGAHSGKDLHYVGKVGTGFSQETLSSLFRRFRSLLRQTPPFVNAPREKGGARWLAPKLVAQIAFLEWTADGRLRHPVFLGLRDDKKPEDCRLPKVFR